MYEATIVNFNSISVREESLIHNAIWEFRVVLRTIDKYYIADFGLFLFISKSKHIY